MKSTTLVKNGATMVHTRKFNSGRTETTQAVWRGHWLEISTAISVSVTWTKDKFERTKRCSRVEQFVRTLGRVTSATALKNWAEARHNARWKFVDRNEVTQSVEVKRTCQLLNEQETQAWLETHTLQSSEEIPTSYRYLD